MKNGLRYMMEICNNVFDETKIVESPKNEQPKKEKRISRNPKNEQHKTVKLFIKKQNIEEVKIN